ncbi:MAG: amidohydrolase family protein [Planctomycetota bacterium]
MNSTPPHFGIADSARHPSVLRCIMVFAIVALSATKLAAHDQIPGAPQSDPIALVGGTIHRVDGDVIESGVIVFEDGKITAIGKSLTLPDGCQTIQCNGKQIYPGLFESISNIGLVEVNSVRASVDTNEIGSDNANLRSWIAVNPDSELIPVARANGILLASIAPDRGDLRGQVGVLAMDGWTYADMLVQGPAGMMVSGAAFDAGEDDDEERAKQRDEKLRKLTERLEEAARYAAARERSPRDQPIDVRLEALLPVVNGDLPMIIDADRRRQIEAAVAFCVTHGIRPIIYGGYDAESCAELLRQYDVPVIIHGTYRLPRRRDEVYDFAYTLPARLKKAGVRFAIGGEGSGYPGGASNARNLPYHAATAVAFGLSAEDAIRAITLSPAEIHGVADRLGSLTVGKDATLIVVDGDILETPSKVERAFIRGAAVDLGSKHETLYKKYLEKYRRAGAVDAKQGVGDR